MESREMLLSRTFVEIADTLVADFDVVDMLTTLASRCVELFEIDEAGLMLVAADGGLHCAASSSHTMRLLELFEVQHDEGPCVDCFRSGAQIVCEDLEASSERWPKFAIEAVNAGIGSAFAVPMRLRDQTIGSLNLLRESVGKLSVEDFASAQAIADIATIGILQHRVAEEQKLLSGQLQVALDSRIVIEQAKGALTVGTGLDMNGAFEALRTYARMHQRRLIDVATSIVDRELDGSDVIRNEHTK